MCIDALSFFISLSAIYLARKRPTKKLSFGYIRAGLIDLVFFSFKFNYIEFLYSEVLGALVSVLLIWVVTGVLVYMAIERCIDQTFEVNSIEMIIVASCGVVFNIV
jgi:zinc transporter 2